MDFINGNKFLEIADFAIDFDHNNLTLDIFKKNAIIFCKTDFLDKLFDFIKFSGRKYLLISHMSDYPVNEVRFRKAPKCIVKWYAENAIYDNPNLIPIPLGLENHKGSSKGKFTNHNWFVNNVEQLRNKEKINPLYCNWNSNTNAARNRILEELRTTDKGLILESGLTFETYCEHMSAYQWVICPPGNGVDTHRLWEALYLGCYPITLENRIYKDYDLPILQIKKWSDISSALLEEHYDKWKDKQYFDQLKMNWWENLIKEEYYKL